MKFKVHDDFRGADKFGLLTMSKRRHRFHHTAPVNLTPYGIDIHQTCESTLTKINHGLLQWVNNWPDLIRHSNYRFKRQCRWPNPCGQNFVGTRFLYSSTIKRPMHKRRSRLDSTYSKDESTTSHDVLIIDTTCSITDQSTLSKFPSLKKSDLLCLISPYPCIL